MCAMAWKYLIFEIYFDLFYFQQHDITQQYGLEWKTFLR